jgi:hypothetical protein
VPEDTPTLLTALPVAERLRRGTGVGARAASAWLRSPRRATRTTSRLNSGGNFLGTATSSPRDKIPQNECQLDLQQSRTASATSAADTLNE